MGTSVSDIDESSTWSVSARSTRSDPWNAGLSVEAADTSEPLMNRLTEGMIKLLIPFILTIFFVLLPYTQAAPSQTACALESSF